MRAKGILTAALAAGVLFLAPGCDGARADQYQRHGNGHQPSYHGKGVAHGWWTATQFGHKRDGGHVYGKRTRNGDRGLSHRDRKSAMQLHRRFDDQRAFRRYLQHRKTGPFAHYWGHDHRRHYVHKQRQPHRYVWYRGRILQLR